MGIISGVAIYFIIWWLVFFAVLTIGNRAPDDEPVSGADRGAPRLPRLKLRVLITTVIAAVGFAAFYGVLNSGLTLDDIPLPSPPHMD